MDRCPSKQRLKKIKMTEKLSSTPLQVVKDLRIPLPDGGYLSAFLVSPEGPGPFPVVFDYYPYRKDDLGSGSLRQHYALARSGYAVLRLDVRGTGGSPGVALDEYVLQEQLDAVSAIHWMSEQPWSSGKVGMFGMSYGGFNSLQVAMHRPPALKAICPMYFTDNRYTDDCHYKGGALQMLYDMATYGLSMVVENALPPHPDLAGEDWSEIWDQHLQNEPWLIRWLENQTNNQQWKQGSLCEDYGAIQCAVYLFGGWRDGYTNCNLRTYQNLRCSKKLLVGPWLHSLPDTGVPGPRIDHVHEMRRFFDYWLKGVQNGVMDEPPVTIYVQQYDPPAADRKATSGFWRGEIGWPVEDLTEMSLFLTRSGRLETRPDATQASLRLDYNPTSGTTFGMFSAASPYLLPVDQRLEEPYSLNWTSAPLEQTVEILGYPQAQLYLEVNCEIATAVVRLLDIAPDGEAALVTKGVLNLTHRAGHENPEAIQPGDIYPVSIRLDATCWQFQPGHRIGLSYSGADFPNTWPSPYLYTARVHLGGEHAAELVLPVRRLDAASRPAPALHPAERVEPLHVSSNDPAVWRVTRDHLAGSVEVFIRTAGESWINERLQVSEDNQATACVYEHEPSRASIRGLSRAELRWPERVVAAQARGQIESTADTFQLSIHLEVKMDGFLHFSRQWTRSIPRNLL